MWKILMSVFGWISTVAFIAKFQLYEIQLCYTALNFFLVSIGAYSIVKQSIEKNKAKRKHTLVDMQNIESVISIARNPRKRGEVLGKLIIKSLEGIKNIMKKIRELWDKFKGIALSIALGILTVIEMYGGYINAWCGDKLVIKGVEVLPYITLAASVVVGIISNGWTKEQKEKIKALFSKSSTTELVNAEIKKTIKDKSYKLSQFSKILATKETEKENLESELVTLENSYNAKQEMFCMTPQLATEEDVQLAHNAVIEVKGKIDAKVVEIESTKATIDNLSTTIRALKSQL